MAVIETKYENNNKIVYEVLAWVGDTQRFARFLLYNHSQQRYLVMNYPKLTKVKMPNGEANTEQAKLPKWYEIVKNRGAVSEFDFMYEYCIGGDYMKLLPESIRREHEERKSQRVPNDKAGNGEVGTRV